jgi:hypothetical protein
LAGKPEKEESKQLMQSHKVAKKRKAEVLFFFATFAYFAPWRETGLFVHGLIHMSGGFPQVGAAGPLWTTVVSW